VVLILKRFWNFIWAHNVEKWLNWIRFKRYQYHSYSSYFLFTTFIGICRYDGIYWDIAAKFYGGDKMIPELSRDALAICEEIEIRMKSKTCCLVR